MKYKIILISLMMLLLVGLVPLASAHTADDPFVTDLIADGGDPTTATDVGEVQVWNDGETLYVKYLIDSDLTPNDPSDDGVPTLIYQVHLHVATSEEDIPQNKQGMPQIGQFMVNETFDPGITEITYEFDLAENGWNANDELTIAAHAVVEKKGGLAGLELALPDTVQFRVKYPVAGGLAYFPEVSVSGLPGGSITTQGWCVDTDRDITQNTSYTANVYSSYGDLTGLVEYPENMDLVNWILNQGFVGTASTSGGNFTYGDVQRAIWTLVEDELSTAGLGPWNQQRVDEILTMATDPEFGGEGFVPGCGDVVAIVLAPVNAENDPNAQIIIAQVILAELLVPCDTISETAWGFGTEFNPKKSWAMYFNYTVQEPPQEPTVTPGYSNLTQAAGVRYRGNSSGNEIYLGITDLAVGGNRIEASYPNVYANWQDGTYDVTFSFDEIENAISTTIEGVGGTESLTYDFDDLLDPGCPVENWNAMDINVVDRLTTGELAFNNVMLDGNSLGNFDDEGWKNWTVSNYDFSQGFEVSGDMVVSGWTGSETNKLQIMVGCLP